MQNWRKLVSVVETAQFSRSAESFLTRREIDSLIDAVAENPKAGVLMPGTGGVRKLRLAYGGRGKSGGARAVYYFHSEAMPLILLTAYAKSAMSDVAPADRAKLKDQVRSLVKYFLG